MATISGIKTSYHDTNLVTQAWKKETCKVWPHKHPAEAMTKRFGQTGKIKQKKYYWGTRTPVPAEDTLTSAHTAAGTTATVTNIARWRIGDMFQPVDGGANVTFLVSAVTQATSTITYADIAGTDRAMASGITVRRIGPAGAEGGAFRTAASVEATRYYNELREDEQSWNISNVKNTELLYINEKEKPWQVRAAVYQQVESLNIEFYYGQLYDSSSAARVGGVQGIDQFLNDNGTAEGTLITNFNAAGNITEDLLEEMLRNWSKKSYENGTDKYIFCDGIWLDFFAAWNRKYGEKKLIPGKSDMGFPLRTIYGNHGCDFHIIQDPNLDPMATGIGADLFCIDVAAVERIYFDDAEFGVCDAVEINTTQTDSKNQTGTIYTFHTYGWGAPEFHGKCVGATGYTL